ncbi:superoxide dismutase family protein [Paraliobacillus salinarum]|uniref:superoxide dismutase family protein n=1 Tax=Paraliobacillus salinarum TaxID=1158996 RepID=UPI0015F4645C|nr:superoxide dismutase family protein [Paraliobacillus salinarum]
MKVIIVLISTLLLAACQPNDYSPLKVSLYNQANDPVGTATFTEEANGVAVKVSVEGLAPGLHGIHIHEYSKCEAPDFKSAGSHYNPAGNEHGLMYPDGAHLGDMPNIEAGSDGTAEAEFELPEATLSEGQYSLLQDDGTSIIIHEKQDDGVSQPSGDAGERVVCGKITLDEAKEDMPPTDPTETDKKKEEE